MMMRRIEKLLCAIMKALKLLLSSLVKVFLVSLTLGLVVRLRAASWDVEGRVGLVVCSLLLIYPSTDPCAKVLAGSEVGAAPLAS